MNEELVTVGTTYDIVEAEFLRNHLEAEGFEVFLADENVVGAYNLLANAVGGIKIKVPAEDAKDAYVIIDELRNADIEDSENPNFSEEIDTGWGECEMCLSRDLTPEREIVGWKWILAFFMIPSVMAKRKLVCNNCGNQWMQEKSDFRDAGSNEKKLLD